MPQSSPTFPPLQDGDLLAAIDLGSNSFHMVIARYLLGQLRVVDRLRETVRMADGLDGKGGLSAEARQRALECLARFGQRIRNIPPYRVRALATNTVRQLRSPLSFLMPAETALGHAIEVVNGREEARLIYLGVAHAQPPKPGQRRLVIDIGGGSTEFIIGSGMQPLERESLQGAITAQALPLLRDELLRARHINDINLPTLSSERRPIIAGGVLVLEAAFQSLGLQKLLVSKAAMREGILYDIMGRASDNDPRDESVAALTRRYDIDAAQALRVEATAQRLFEQVAESWKLDSDDARMLGWAARLHELGLMIAHSGYHTHGSYVIEHSDIAGFSRQEQQMLAALIRTHRRGVPRTAFDALPDRLLLPARRTAALLRLAVLLHRSHEDDPIPTLDLSVDGNTLSLVLDKVFIDARPLLRADLVGEAEGMAGLGISFRPFVA